MMSMKMQAKAHMAADKSKQEHKDKANKKHHAGPARMSAAQRKTRLDMNLSMEDYETQLAREQNERQEDHKHQVPNKLPNHIQDELHKIESTQYESDEDYDEESLHNKKTMQESVFDRLDTSYSCMPMTQEEQHACESILSRSTHSVLSLMPNHHIDKNGVLRGFRFECHADEKATVLPICKDMFHLIAMYECKQKQKQSRNYFSNPESTDTAQAVSSIMHPQAINIINELDECKHKLQEYLKSMHTLQQSVHTASFDCIRDEISSTRYTQHIPDKRIWSTTQPCRLSLCHAYVRTHQKDAIEHKLFIVVSGYLKIACEELENLWQDSHAHVTCKDFVQSEECHWLRLATMRNHNRIAYEVAKLLNLQIESCSDLDDPNQQQKMAIPTTSTFKTDICLTMDNRVQMVDMGCFLNKSSNGVLFEMFASEGYWLFTGAKDYASEYVYGHIAERDRRMNCFPSQTIQFHRRFRTQQMANVIKIRKARYPMSMYEADTKSNSQLKEDELYFFPHEAFMQKLQMLGFDRNDNILHLMPILSHEDVR